MSIAGINPATPGANDNAGLGDDQIRDLKAAIKACFGGVAGPVKAGVAGGLATDADITALFDRLTAVEGAIGGGGAGFVVGMVLDWYGTKESIPPGWKICDGSFSTPNAEGRFPLAANSASGAPRFDGATSGGAVGAAGFTGPAGGHDHAIWATSLTLAQLPAALNGAVEIKVATFSAGQNHSDTNHVAGSNGGGWLTYYSAPLRVNGVNGDGHTHTMVAQGDHVHSLGASGMPPWTAFYRIMYTG